MNIPRIAVSTALVLGLGAATVACGDKAENYSDEELRDKLVEILVDDSESGPGLEQAQAECTIDYLFDNLERDDINQLANAQDASDATDEQVSTLTDGLLECTL